MFFSSTVSPGIFSFYHSIGHGRGVEPIEPQDEYAFRSLLGVKYLVIGVDSEKSWNAMASGADVTITEDNVNSTTELLNNKDNPNTIYIENVVKSFVPNNYGFTAATSYAEDELVFFSVPYEKNAFTATVNGEPVDVEEVDCGLMAIPVPAGEADIVVTYHTPGLKESITISIAGIIIWILYALVWYNKGKKKGTPELQEAKESTEAVE